MTMPPDRFERLDTLERRYSVIPERKLVALRASPLEIETARERKAISLLSRMLVRHTHTSEHDCLLARRNIARHIARLKELEAQAQAAE